MVQFVLTDDDVVSTSSKIPLAPGNTWKCGELKEALEKLASSTSNNIHSLIEGAPCEALRPSGGGWKKGKVYLSVVFVPDDEPEQKPLESDLG